MGLIRYVPAQRLQGPAEPAAQGAQPAPPAPVSAPPAPVPDPPAPVSARSGQRLAQPAPPPAPPAGPGTTGLGTTGLGTTGLGTTGLGTTGLRRTPAANGQPATAPGQPGPPPPGRVNGSSGPQAGASAPAPPPPASPRPPAPATAPPKPGAQNGGGQNLGGQNLGGQNLGGQSPSSSPHQNTQVDQREPANEWQRGASRGLRSVAARETWAGRHRPADNRVLAGVAAALADMIGVGVLAARWALVALTFFGGVGIAVYVVAWLFLPSEGSDRAIAGAALGDRRTVQLVLAAASALIVLMVCISLLGSTALLGAVSPGLVSLAGLVAIWRHAGPDDRVAARRLAGQLSGASPAAVPTRRRLLVAVARFLAGAALVAICTSTLLRPKHLNGTDLTVALAALGVIAGFALILAPWWLRLGRELSGERRERARAEQRAEIAEHLHDSVLQTLALIQRAANDPHQVQRLARAQERQLRAWLFDGAPRGPMGLEEPGTVSEALASLQQEVESVHGVRVEVVTVGDTALDERSRALVAAAREAVVNSAKWSEAEVVSIYAEVEPEMISVFVRDRGRGFDPKTVAQDRKGISESIKARVSRNGGTATVRSAPGKGTEVALRLPRRAQG